MDTCKQTFPLQSKDAKQRLGRSVQKNIFRTSSILESARLAFVSVIFAAYRYVLSPILHIFGAAQAGACRYPQNCSSYAHDAIVYKGIIRGSLLALWRVLSCNPWMKPSPKLMNISISPRNSSRISPHNFSNSACERQNS